MFIENHYRILDNAQYIHHIIKRKVQVLLKRQDLFEWEEFLSDKRSFKFYKVYELFVCEILANLICPSLLLALFLVWRYTNFFSSNSVKPSENIEILFIIANSILCLIVFFFELYLASQYKKICDKKQLSWSLPRETLLANYGFKQGDEFKVSCLEEEKIVLEKK